MKEWKKGKTNGKASGKVEKIKLPGFKLNSA